MVGAHLVPLRAPMFHYVPIVRCGVYLNRLGPTVGYDRVSGKSDMLGTHRLTLMATEYGPNDSVPTV